MSTPRHAPSDSFGDFVSADAHAARSDVLPPQLDPTLVTEQPLASNKDVLDLRAVERKLDEQRHAKLAEAMTTAPAIPEVSKPVDGPRLTEAADLVPEPDAGESVSHRTEEEDAASEADTVQPEAPSSSDSKSWSSSLWSKLAALSSMTDLRANTSKPPLQSQHPPLRRRRSVIRGHSSTIDAPISGAPGFDARSTRHLNKGNWSLSADAERTREQQPIPVALKGRRPDTDVVMDEWRAARIQALLPRRLRLGNSWSLVYSLDQHGASLATLYDRVARAMDPRYRAKTHTEAWLRGSSDAAANAALGTSIHVGGGVSMEHAGLVLAIQDNEDNIFGAFINEPLRVAPHYYGNGECFLWKTVRRQLPVPPVPSDGGARPSDDLHPDLAVEVFRWTGLNDYNVLSESDYLSVGGGDGRYGLWIDAALTRGLSGRCPAFNNEVLCNAHESSAPHAADNANVPTADLLGTDQPTPKAEKFFVIGVEVWAVGLE